MTSTTALALALITGNAWSQDSTWFVVAEIDSNRGDSYLLELSDPEAIADARSLVEDGQDSPVGSIVVANAVPSRDGFNRDVLQDGAPLWSWHVTEFVQFADITIELCDGNPQLVEDDPEGFLDNTDGQICFWSYTVVAELDEPPAYRITEQVDGAWFNPDTPGQGILFDAFGDREELFGAWFTFDTPAAKLGSPEQRWFTAQGSYLENLATLDLTLTTGGEFNAPAPVDNSTVGSLEVDFQDCNHASLSYSFDDGPVGTIPLRRLLPLTTCGQ